MKTLTFDEKGRCTNAPAGWIVDVCKDSAWRWVAQHEADFLTLTHITTRDAAERACEAAMWRLGILALGPWIHDAKETKGRADVLYVAEGFSASTFRHDVEGTTYVDWEVCDGEATGRCKRVKDAHAIAEACLRALVAQAVLDGGSHG